MTDAELTKAAEESMEAFASARAVAVELGEALKKHQPNLLTIAFALCVLERSIKATYPNWDSVSEYADDALEMMQAVGLAPTVQEMRAHAARRGNVL